MKNNLINRIVYLEKTRSLLNQNVDVILREFFPNSEISPNNVICLVHPAGEETHNKGQITVRVTLKERGQPKELEKAIFYKPRSALTEKAIIDLFIDLNKVKSEDTPDLPFYKIYSLGENGSLWESIDGNNDLGVSAFEHLQMMEESKKVSIEVLEKARRNLLRLETICRKIGVCDLHYQNIFLRKEVEWIPIDMEVIMFGRATGVFGTENPPLVMPISSEEERLIDQFNKAQFWRFSRLVPVRTAALITESLSFNGAVRVAALLEKALKNEFVNIQHAELERFAKEDVDNGDISILYLKEENLYYGSHRKIIGTLKPREAL